MKPTALFVFIVFLASKPVAYAACQSCLLVIPHRHYQQSSLAAWGTKASAAFQQSTQLEFWKQVAVHRASRAIATKPVLMAAAVSVATYAVAHRRRRYSAPWLSSSKEGEEGSDGAEEESESDESNTKPAEKIVSTGMISALGVYKTCISPLLPPSCRFVPTCSQYGVKAIEEFGPAKGTVLIAWRLLRCSPFGGKGIDYPQWPPVPYTYGSW